MEQKSRTGKLPSSAFAVISVKTGSRSAWINIKLPRSIKSSDSELGKRGTNFVMNNITEAFKGKTLVITGGTGSF